MKIKILIQCIIHLLHISSCEECERNGISSKYYGETSASAYERSQQHLTDAESKIQSNHIYMHLKKADPEWIEKEWKGIFRFEVSEQHRSGFSRQISEAIQMQQSGSVIMNLKD